MVLHRFGTDPHYQVWRAHLLGQNLQAEGQAGTTRIDQAKLAIAQLQAQAIAEKSSAAGTQVDRGDFVLLTSQRNTPPLFGTGLIDAIPDAVLEAAARKTDPAFPEVQGRVSRLKDGRIGRFGWKGQTASLKDFDLTACAVELGLEVPGQPQVGRRRPLITSRPGLTWRRRNAMPWWPTCGACRPRPGASRRATRRPGRSRRDARRSQRLAAKLPIQPSTSRPKLVSDRNWCQVFFSEIIGVRSFFQRSQLVSGLFFRGKDQNWDRNWSQLIFSEERTETSVSSFFQKKDELTLIIPQHERTSMCKASRHQSGRSGHHWPTPRPRAPCRNDRTVSGRPPESVLGLVIGDKDPAKFAN